MTNTYDLYIYFENWSAGDDVIQIYEDIEL